MNGIMGITLITMYQGDGLETMKNLFSAFSMLAATLQQ